MDDKTRAKIEAMADLGVELHDKNGATGKAQPPRKWDNECLDHFMIRYGATPWAEWCERFEKTIQEHNDMWKGIDGGPGCIILNKTLKQYRQWIKGDSDG